MLAAISFWYRRAQGVRGSVCQGCSRCVPVEYGLPHPSLFDEILPFTRLRSDARSGPNPIESRLQRNTRRARVCKQVNSMPPPCTFCPVKERGIRTVSFDLNG